MSNDTEHINDLNSIIFIRILFQITTGRYRPPNHTMAALLGSAQWCRCGCSSLLGGYCSDSKQEYYSNAGQLGVVWCRGHVASCVDSSYESGILCHGLRGMKAHFMISAVTTK